MRPLVFTAGYLLMIVGFCSLFGCLGMALVSSGALDDRGPNALVVNLDRSEPISAQAMQSLTRRESLGEVCWSVAIGIFTGGWWSVGIVLSAGIAILGMTLVDKSRRTRLPDNPLSGSTQPEFSFGQYTLGMPIAAYGDLKKVGFLATLLLGYSKSLGRPDAIYNANKRAEEWGEKWRIRLGSRRRYVCSIAATTGCADKDKWEAGMAKAYEKLCEQYGPPAAAAEVPTWITAFGSVRLLANVSSVAGMMPAHALVIEAVVNAKRSERMPQQNN